MRNCRRWTGYDLVMNTPESSRWLVWGQTTLLGFAIIGMFTLGNRVRSLEERVEQLQASQAQVVVAAAQGADSEPRVRRNVQSSDSTVSAARATSGNSPSGSQDVTVIEDHLWSEDGRQAIGDVLEEREEEDRERRTERWQQMMQYRTDQAVGAVSEDLNLSEEDTEQVTLLVNDFMDARSQRWRQMSDGGEGSDFADIEQQYEETREQIEQDLVEILGEDGLDTLRSEIRGGSGWR